MRDKILSIQSKLIYGYVGSNIAEFAIQLHGLDSISFPTVYLAAHTGHQPSYGVVINKDLFEDYITGVKALGILSDVANIVTGYIGSDHILTSAAKFIKEIKEKYPDRVYICDPVMGDIDVGLYVEEATAQKLMTNLIPLADIITPNHFEFEYIVGSKVNCVKDALDGVAANAMLKDKTIIVTSCQLEDAEDDQIEILIIKDGAVDRISCKTIDIDTTGTGDFFAALLASQIAKGKDIKRSVVSASKAISKALEYTVKRGNVEMNAASILYALGKD